MSGEDDIIRKEKKRVELMTVCEFDPSECGGAYEKNGELHQYRQPRSYPT